MITLKNFTLLEDATETHSGTPTKKVLLSFAFNCSQKDYEIRNKLSDFFHELPSDKQEEFLNWAVNRYSMPNTCPKWVNYEVVFDEEDNGIIYFYY